MAGIIIHLIFGVISAIIVYQNFRKLQYSAAILIGNFLHDIFIIAYAPLLLRTFSPMALINSSYFAHRDIVFNSLWMIIQTIFVLFFLLFQKYIRKKEFKDFEYNIGLLLLGIITHATVDMMIQETGIWI